jgi:DNA-binding PadR family transcriptional regulator
MSGRNAVPAPRRPLSPTVLHILLSLAEGARHGYSIKQEAETRSEGAVRLGPGTLYEAIQRLQEAGLIRETSGDEDPVNGQEAQRRYYTLTPRGKRLLREEIQQLGRVVDYARTRPELA